MRIEKGEPYSIAVESDKVYEQVNGVISHKVTGGFLICQIDDGTEVAVSTKNVSGWVKEELL